MHLLPLIPQHLTAQTGEESMHFGDQLILQIKQTHALSYVRSESGQQARRTFQVHAVLSRGVRQAGSNFLCVKSK